MSPLNPTKAFSPSFPRQCLRTAGRWILGTFILAGCGDDPGSGVGGTETAATDGPATDGTAGTGGTMGTGPGTDGGMTTTSTGTGTITDGGTDTDTGGGDLGECDEAGGVITEMNSPYPSYYETYCFPQPDDSVACSGATNDGATIDNVFFAQTHVLEPDWSFFYLISDRPALLQVIVTGSGPSPEVSVSGWLGDDPLGTLCLAGPAELPASVDASVPTGDDRFAVTLPQSWLKSGLRVEIKAGSATTSFSAEQLGVRHASDINTVMVNMDVLNYNDGRPDKEAPETFLADWAGALPGAKMRFGVFPGRMVFPTFAIGTPSGVVVLDNRLCGGNETPGVDPCVEATDFDNGFVNAAALRYIDALIRATGEYPYAFYFGHTQYLFPGGWGGGKTWVSGDYQDVTIHEGGHAMSLPHWGNAYGINPDPGSYLYPYGGEGDYGGGHGERWNYYQDVQQFVSPICEIPDHQYFGTERSDAMQRDRKCWEWRGSQEGPWDGFSDFSALAIYRYVNGALEVQSGEVPYRGGSTPYNLMSRPGFPSLEFDDQGNRVLRRYDGFDPQSFEERLYAVPQQWEVPVHTVYASYNADTPAANIVYAPMSYTGNLPAVIDPTDPATFTELLADNGIYQGYFNGPHDLIFRFVYTEGEDLHAVYPHSGTNRNPSPVAGPWHPDLKFMALTIPGDRSLARIELHHRPFVVRGASDDTEGNIRNQSFGITATNFMDDATLLASIDL